MTITKQLAKHFRAVYFGGNWTASNLKDNLADVSWETALTPVKGLNTIATLVYHLNYYVRAVSKVFEGEPLNAKDAYSFDHPTIASQVDWEDFLKQVWLDGTYFASLIEALPEEQLWEYFSDEKYGTYYGNIQGIIEHIHYHLGQIVVIKKIVLKGK